MKLLIKWWQRPCPSDTLRLKRLPNGHITKLPVLTQMSPASLYSVGPPGSELLLCQYLAFHIITFCKARTLENEKQNKTKPGSAFYWAHHHAKTERTHTQRKNKMRLVRREGPKVKVHEDSSCLKVFSSVPLGWDSNDIFKTMNWRVQEHPKTDMMSGSIRRGQLSAYEQSWVRFSAFYRRKWVTKTSSAKALSLSLFIWEKGNQYLKGFWKLNELSQYGPQHVTGTQEKVAIMQLLCLLATLWFLQMPGL